MAFELFDERRFYCSKVVLSYIEGPSNGPAVVLLHEVTSRWQPFQSILPALIENFQVYALDLRGHGKSSHTPGAYRLDDYTHDVYQFIVQHVQTAVTIYGHSLGALVAINLAARHPASVRSLILGDPPLYYHDTPIEATFWRQAFIDLLEFIIDHPDSAEMDTWLARNTPNMSRERREERVCSLRSLDPDVVRAVISDQLMKDVSFSALPDLVSCQVLLLRGNPILDSALREQDVYFAITHFPDIRVLEMDMVGHGIIPAALLPQMKAFIDTSLSLEKRATV